MQSKGMGGMTGTESNENTPNPSGAARDAVQDREDDVVEEDQTKIERGIQTSSDD